MCVCVHVCVYGYMCVCVCMYVCISMYVCMCVCVRAHVDVRIHSCRRILFICTVQSLYYMRVYHRCFLTLACVCVGGLEVGFVSVCPWLVFVYGMGGYVLTRVEIGVLSCTPAEPEESRSTKAQYTCRPYRCTQYICLYICFDDLG